MSLPDDTQFPSQWHFDRIGDISTIWQDYTGAGINVGVYDDGVQYAHGDLDGNYNAALHVVVGGITYDGNTLGGVGGHGTAVAGLIAAERNGEGTVGIAYGASITGVNIFDPASALYISAATRSPFYEAVAQSATFDVVNNSWGSIPNFTASQNANVVGSFTALTLAGWQFAAETGRGGLGTVVVKSAGNEFRDSNGNNLNSSRYSVTVNAVGDSGFAASYSNHGFNSLVSAPGSELASNGGGLGIITTDLLGADGYNLRADETGSYDYTDDFGGTSAAGPIVAAVAALMLDANPNLGWRDVHNILAISATHTGSALGATVAGSYENGTWLFNSAANWNGGGMHFHTNYGYGMVNAYNAARMAEVWSLFAPAQTSANEFFSTSGTVASGAAIPTTGTVSVNFGFVGDLMMENVSMKLNLTHSFWTELRIYLISPEGTRVRLADGTTGNGSTSISALEWTFGIDALRGERSVGNWTLEINDVATGDAGTLTSFELSVFGASAFAGDVYHYTDEFVLLAMLDNSRRILTDADGGTDWVNLAAMHGNLSINLGDLAYSSVNGQQLFRIAAGTVIENVVTGDGNDTVRGNAVANNLVGMRGNDSLFGLAADDTLDGGRGVDTLTGGLGNDTFIDPTGDIIVELAGGGTDTVRSSTGFSLFSIEHVENLTLTGSADVDGSGNGLGNVITGNSGNNILNGGAGLDTLIGGGGNDTYFWLLAIDPVTPDTIVELAGGGDRDLLVSDGAVISLAGLAEVEDATATGVAAYITGNAKANRLTGDAGNDTLEGGGGVDTLTGGAGNDTYVSPSGDIITELAAGGTDTVESNATFSLAALAQVERLTLTGTGNFNASGNALANVLTGNSGNNILNGNAGADTMAGGLGNDIYYVDTAGDVITELSGGGTDLVSSSVSRTLSANIENLNLSGTANIDGNGNTQANIINGNTGNNILRGDAGADTLNGGGGNDILLGGTSSDSLNPGVDAVRDIIRFSAVADSTGAQRDIVTGMDLNAEDRFDFTVVPTSLVIVGSGALNLATINTDMAAAVDAALAVNGAVLFDPGAGDLDVAGHLFVVVDANGDGSYSPDQDYVVQLVNSTGFLTLDDFI
jgi:Ca2+-binding RTX toxin-like protein/subtilisin-like proprotein convertase family protein